MSKISRNDPCPCGSGLKYKKCCLTSQLPAVTSMVWQRMRRAEGELVPVLFEHSKVYYNDSAVARAWDEFTLWTDAPFDGDQYPEQDTLFPPWYLYSWTPLEDDLLEGDFPEPDKTIAAHYLEVMGQKISSFERRFIEAVGTSPFSFYLVTDCVPGQTITFKDLLRDGEVTVQERTASHSVEPGTMVYARVITMDGDSILFGLAPTVLRISYLDDVIGLRDAVAQEQGLSSTVADSTDLTFLDTPLLFEYEFPIRALYFRIRDEIYNPQMPELRNTDGDLLEPITLFYSLKCTPGEAFDALTSLSLTGPEDLLESAVFDGKQLVSVTVPWLVRGNAQHAGWNNTLMGELHIHGSSLTVEVNSAERAKSIKRRIGRRLGKRAVFEGAETGSVHDLLAKADRQTSDEDLVQLDQSEDLMALPEVQQEIQRLAHAHWMDWLDQELPALKGQTPRQAAKTATGRERLEALLLDFEQSSLNNPFSAFDFNTLRRELNLK